MTTEQRACIPNQLVLIPSLTTSMNCFYSQTNKVENEINKVVEDHRVFVGSYRAVLATKFPIGITVSTMLGMKFWVALMMKMPRKDANHYNDEPDNSVVGIGAKEDAALDLKSQDNKDKIADLHLVLCSNMDWYLSIIEI